MEKPVSPSGSWLANRASHLNPCSLIPPPPTISDTLISVRCGSPEADPPGIPLPNNRDELGCQTIRKERSRNKATPSGPLHSGRPRRERTQTTSPDMLRAGGPSTTATRAARWSPGLVVRGSRAPGGAESQAQRDKPAPRPVKLSEPTSCPGLTSTMRAH